MEKDICNVKHEALDKFLDATDKILGSHEERLSKLELSSTALNTQMKNMCNKLDKLINALYDIIKSMVGGIIVLGIGFIIWYIQKL